MKKSTIIIEGTPFTYDDEMEDISYNTISAISEDEAGLLLNTTDRLFGAIGLKFYLAFGTLLGAVRDKTLIKGDEDVDIFIDDEDLLRKNLPQLSEHGYRVCRIAEGILYSFRIDGSRSYIDVYIHKKFTYSIWNLWCDCLYNRAVPRRLIKKKDIIDFLGSTYAIPAEPEKLLEFWYGNDWRIPVRSHNFTYDTPTHYWWEMKGKPRLKRIINCIKLPFVFLVG